MEEKKSGGSKGLIIIILGILGMLCLCCICFFVFTIGGGVFGAVFSLNTAKEALNEAVCEIEPTDGIYERYTTPNYKLTNTSAEFKANISELQTLLCGDIDEMGISDIISQGWNIESNSTGSGSSVVVSFSKDGKDVQLELIEVGDEFKIDRLLID